MRPVEQNVLVDGGVKPYFRLGFGRSDIHHRANTLCDPQRASPRYASCVLPAGYSTLSPNGFILPSFIDHPWATEQTNRQSSRQCMAICFMAALTRAGMNYTGAADTVHPLRVLIESPKWRLCASGKSPAGSPAKKNGAAPPLPWRASRASGFGRSCVPPRG